MTPIFSIITPTHRRGACLPLAYAGVVAQSVGDWEWLVLDDSPEPSTYMQRLEDPRVRYFHQPQRLSIGAKRNLLCDHARGAIIVNFDDDDYYGPR